MALYSMDATFVTPTPFFSKPRLATKDLSTHEFYYTNTKSNNSYNLKSNIEPLFAYYSQETLFKRFTDTTLAKNDASSFGTALFSGELKQNIFGYSYTKNINKNKFISFSTGISSLQVKDLAIHPLQNNVFLTDDQIAADTNLTNYLNDLYKILFPKNSSYKSPNMYTENYLQPTTLTFGWIHSFQNFETIDFIDVSLQTGLKFPEYHFDQKYKPLLNLPLNPLQNIGIILQANASIGFYDWITLGSTLLCIPYISNSEIIPLNTSASNKLLFDHHAMTTIHHEPYFYGNFFIEADHFIPHINAWFGISYEKQGKTHYTPHNTNEYSKAMINEYPFHTEWERILGTVSGEIDFASKSSRNLPRITFIYTWTIWGSSVIKTRSMSGKFILEFMYTF